MRRLPTIDPRTYQRIAELALVALTTISLKATIKRDVHRVRAPCDHPRPRRR